MASDSKKVLFIDTVHPVLFETLENNGFDCTWAQDWTEEKILTEIHDFTGIVIRSRIKIGDTFLAKSTKLKFIARSGAGLENIDLEASKNRGVQVHNSPEGNMVAVGEQVLGMLLMLMNNLKRADAEVREGIWKREENRGYEIARKTVGIIGFGNMGSATAQRFRGFDCKILAFDKYKSNYAPDYVKEVDLKTLLNESDIISFHTPLTDETHYYFDHAFLYECKKPIYLINAARGAVVKTKTLVHGLENGTILGACLDVLEYEKFNFEQLSMNDLPEDFKYLIESDKVILSPHIAGWTHESYYKLSTYLADKILKQFGIK